MPIRNWLFSALLLLPLTATAEKLQIKTICDGLHHPWGLVFVDDDQVLVTERSGQLNRVDINSGERVVIEGTPQVVAQNQGGLLDVALHPDFGDENHWVYLTYAGADPDDSRKSATHLGRGVLVDNRLADFETLFVATPYVDSGRHFGSRIAFDNDGYLFFTTGDRGERDRSQDLGDHNGSVLRLYADGRIPEDNPFVNEPAAKDAIYSYGHRNPQGMVIHPLTGRLWLHEHGPRGGDEINLPIGGENFGWPLQTHGREYHGPEIAPESVPGLVDPIYHWTPSIAPSGMHIHDGHGFPQWRGQLFVGALAHRHLAELTLEDEAVVAEQQHLLSLQARIRAVTQGPDGALYVLTDAADGALLRLTPSD